MTWNRLSLTLYIFAIINWCGFMYSTIKNYQVPMILSLVTFLILVYTSANIEDE